MLQANHMDMCRYTGPNDPNYRIVAGELRRIYTSIQSTTSIKVDDQQLPKDSYSLTAAFRLDQLISSKSLAI
jgi:protein SERAC1